jgi:hypothetical protein
MHDSPNDLFTQVQWVCGQLLLEKSTLEMFSDEAVTFLNDLSKSIRNDRSLNKFTDLKTFSFWCRAANVNKIKSSYTNRKNIVGRGIALHITPSNVAMNFAYSLAFGLLAGNLNIVRLPSKDFVQVELLINKINALLVKPEYEKIKGFISLIRYERSITISQKLSEIADVRLIWGSDETIKNFKLFATKPRCLDLTFSDRYSLALIDPEEIINLSDAELAALTERFFNDSYFMDQRGCSSPQSVIWTKPEFGAEKSRFWKSLINIVADKYDFNISVAADKFLTLSEAAGSADIDFRLLQSDFRVSRLQVTDFSKIETIRCNFGIFVEGSLKHINEINSFISDRFQTITYYGLAREAIIDVLREGNHAGVDRIVPVGRAFDMGHIWDGFDIIAMSSRIIGE